MRISYSVYLYPPYLKAAFIVEDLQQLSKSSFWDDKRFPQTHSPIWKIIVKQPTAVHHGASCAYPVPRLQAHCSNTWQTDAHTRITRQQITAQTQIFYRSTKWSYISLWATGIGLNLISGILEGLVKGTLFFSFCRGGSGGMKSNPKFYMKTVIKDDSFLSSENGQHLADKSWTYFTFIYL